MVTILLGNGFEEAEALVPADLLRRAGADVVLASVCGAEVTGAHGITVKADATLKDLDPREQELVVVPGGLGGVQAILASSDALAFIKSVYTLERFVAAICAGPTVLAALGLLEGKQAVCFPGMEDRLTGAEAKKGTPVVADGRVVTGEAAGSAFAFGLMLIEKIKGRPTAQRVADEVYYHGEF